MHKVCAWRRIEARKKESLALSNVSAEPIRDWSQPIYFLGQNPVSLTGAVITTSTSAANASGFLQISLSQMPRRKTLGLMRGHGAGVFRQPHQKPTD